ncbi:TnpV protein [Hominibacterium faecale]|uniref:TnpV protein n=1 Tax=Hominibacterium faecale TaxID=2839743 RepID=UPI0039E75C6A
MIAYRQNGDYQIPNIEITNQPEGEIGRFGRMRQTYLKENNLPYYNQLLMEFKLKAHLQKTDQEATERMMQMEEQLKQKWGLEESLKTSDPMSWVQKMNQIRQVAEEIVLEEIVYN